MMISSSTTTMAPMSSSSMKVPLLEQLLPVNGLSNTVFFGKTNQQQRQHQPIIIPSSLTSIGINAIPKKPMRPLTAYHIFFQLEREYIIQTTAGEDADKSIHDKKIIQDDVPLRYKNIKLLPDWYAGPGKKKQKRKHRKQHGKIGFLELSRVISTRWAKLEQLDLETKDFVQKIARQELDEYYREMKEYKEITKELDILPPSGMVAATVSSKKKSKVAKKKIRRSSASSGRASNPSMTLPWQEHKPFMAPLLPDDVNSSSSCFQASNFTSLQLTSDIDYFLSCIDKKTQELMQQKKKLAYQLQLRQLQHEQQGSCGTPFFSTPYRNMIEPNQVPKKRKTFHRQDSALSVSKFHPLMDSMPSSNFLLQQQQEDYVQKPVMKKARVVSAPSSACASPANQTSVEVDICDDEILQLWKSHN